MKLLLTLLLLVPIIAFAQCPQYVGNNFKDVQNLVGVVEKFSQFKLLMNDTSENYTRIVFKDSAEFSLIIFRVARTKKLVGTQVVSSAPTVTSIFINGPADRIDNMVNEYFIPLIKSCNPKTSPTWIFWNDQKLVYTNNGEHNGIKMKSIEIEKG